MGWDSASRLKLASLQAQGAVAVRYEANGCDVRLEVLPDCIGARLKYEYLPYSAEETKEASTATELYAQLPLGATKLAGQLSSGNRLRTDYVLVGQAYLPANRTVTRQDLAGAGCTRATHVVSSVYVGGFAFVVGTDDELSSEASWFIAGGGARQRRRVRRLAFEGYPAHCEEALSTGTPHPLCKVPLRLGLQSLEAGSTACPQGTTWDGARCLLDQQAANGLRSGDQPAYEAYSRIDQSLREQFDYDTGHHRFSGTVTEVITAYRNAATDAKRWHDMLQYVVDSYESPRWTIGSKMRQGSLYDSIATGLRAVAGGSLRLFSHEQEEALAAAERSDSADLKEKAQAIRSKIRRSWEDARSKELRSADELAVVRYSEAVVLAHRYHISSSESDYALSRLAYLESILTSQEMQRFTSRLRDLNYTPGLFRKLQDTRQQ